MTAWRRRVALRALLMLMLGMLAVPTASVRCNRPAAAPAIHLQLSLDCLLQECGQMNPETDLAQCRAEFERIVATSRGELAKARQSSGREAGLTPRETAGVLSRVILTDRDVRYRSQTYWKDALFTSVLAGRKGNCAATSMLYYLVARELDLPIHLASTPGHVAVRWDDGQTRFVIETTDGGRIYRDDEVRGRTSFAKIDCHAAGFLRKLSDRELRD